MKTEKIHWSLVGIQKWFQDDVKIDRTMGRREVTLGVPMADILGHEWSG